MREFTFTTETKKFSGNLGWTYAPVPTRYTDSIKLKKGRGGNWGLVPAQFTLGDSTWQASLLPMGDGTFFVPLKAQIRKKEQVEAGDTVTISVRLR